MSEKLAAGDSRRTYRLTRWSTPWIVVPLAVVYELLVLTGRHEGGPLSHVLWWATGAPGTARWVIVGGALAGFLLWLVTHLLWRTPGPVDLAVWCVACVVLLGVYSTFGR